MKAYLGLEDGSVYTGRAFGAEGECQGEVVFNTAMTGYQEILTDPSYKGQIVLMTYPMIGNYGICSEDVESNRVWCEGFIAREFSKISSNWRAQETLDQYLKRNGMVAIEGIDTRAVTKKLRVTGSLNGIISTTISDNAELVARAKAVPKMENQDLVRFVTRQNVASYSTIIGEERPGLQFKVALIDCGVKWNIVRLLVEHGCDVTIFPADTPADAILGKEFDGVLLSNGPGDPAAVTYTVETVKAVIAAGIPIFGICLGHQILSLAAGARTYKLKFGHHGANHPVKNLETGAIEITSQNHGFAVDEKSAEKAGFVVTHLNLNDGTAEGLRHTKIPAFCVQYHPEASPGPHDSRYLFKKFIHLMKSQQSSPAH